MSALKFKTNITCTGCLGKVTPHLNDTPGIIKWEVDLLNPNKVLQVDTAEANVNDVVAAVNKAGYEAVQVQ